MTELLTDHYKQIQLSSQIYKLLKPNFKLIRTWFGNTCSKFFQKKFKVIWRLLEQHVWKLKSVSEWQCSWVVSKDFYIMITQKDSILQSRREVNWAEEFLGLKKSGPFVLNWRGCETERALSKCYISMRQLLVIGIKPRIEYQP